MATELTKPAFAQKLKDWRARKNISQAEAADKLGLSVNTLQNWEIERNMPRGRALDSILRDIK